jgi:nucleotide sugar dehydrogenase
VAESRRELEIVVIGCGAVGLPLAVAFARVGRRVTGIDIDPARVAALEAGRTGLMDEGLEAAFQETAAIGRLSFSGSLTPADAARAYVIAVPTPAEGDHGWRRESLDAAMAAIRAVAREGELVCIRSTVPIGVTRAYAHDEALFLAYCPDRTVAGRGFMGQFDTPHLVGALTPEAGVMARQLFAQLGPVTGVGDPETAEAVKLLTNVKRDLDFAFANQVALICEAAGIDASMVREAGAGGYPRFFMARPGPAGGPCLTKDVRLLTSSLGLKGVDLSLLLAARRLNEGLAEDIAGRIDGVLSVRGPGRAAVAVLGLAFKGAPPTLDRRGAFAADLSQALLRRRPDLDLRTWDPASDPGPAARDDAVRGAAVVVLANDHPDLAAVGDLAPLMAPDGEIFDMCGLAPSLTGALTVHRFGAGGSAR